MVNVLYAIRDVKPSISWREFYSGSDAHGWYSWDKRKLFEHAAEAKSILWKLRAQGLKVKLVKITRVIRTKSGQRCECCHGA